MSVPTRADAQSCGISAADATFAMSGGWSVSPVSCMTAGQPTVSMPPAPTPMLVTQQRINPTGNKTPGRRPLTAGGDPVLGDGEFFEQRSDIQFAGFGPHYEFKRTYRSGVNFKSELGYGWDHNFDKRLIGAVAMDGPVQALIPYCYSTRATDYPGIDSNGGIDYQDGELNVVHFKPISKTADPQNPLHYIVTYSPPPGVNMTLREDWLYINERAQPDRLANTWTMTDEHGNVLVFDRLGYLQSLSDVAGNKLTFSWESSSSNDSDWQIHGQRGRLHSVFDGKRTVYYDYNSAGYLQCITGSKDAGCGTIPARPIGTYAYFDIDGNGDLKAVYHGQSTRAEQYQYASAGVSTAIAPSDCMPNEWIAPYCQKLCAPPNASDLDNTCLNFDYNSKITAACKTVECRWQPNVLPPNLQCQAKSSVTPDPLCMQFNNVLPDCVTGCEQRFQCTGILPDASGGPNNMSFYAFGRPGDLGHNLEYVIDESNFVVVHNTYGTDPWDVSFDRVKKQEFTNGDVVTFEYHDLDVEGGALPIYTAPYTANYAAPYSAPDPAYVTPKASFAQPLVCAESGKTVFLDGRGVSDYGPPAGNSLAVPSSAVVVRDMHGVTKTQYYDHSYNLVREVNATAQETTELNYDPATGHLEGFQEASGVRHCYEYDDRGHIVQNTTLPAPGYAGNTTPMTSFSEFDDANQLVDEWQDVFGARAHTHYGRDALERISYIDEDVTAGQLPERTTYTYDEDPRWPLPFGVRETPATVKLPDGTINAFFGLDPSMGGPTVITLDSGKPTAENRYASYDDLGHVHEAGEVDRYAMQYAFDAGRPIWIRHRISKDWVWIETEIQARDGDGIKLDVIDEPLRKTSTIYRGDKPWIVTVTPKATNNGEQTQTTCYNYAGDGRLLDIALPEGNEIHYEYDAGGRPIGVYKGFTHAATSAWNQACAGHQPPAGDTGQIPLFTASYKPGGFSTYVSQNNVARNTITDGFGRVIQRLTPNPSSDDAAAEQVGYDARGRVVWRAQLDAAHALPAVAYAKPTMQTAGLLSMEETDYDLVDRVTATRHWVIQTGEIYTTTYTYDDLNRSLTTVDRGARTVTTFDGRGRVVGRTFPDGSTMTVVHNLDNDVVTQQTNQGAPLVRTLQYDTRHNLTGVLDENGKTLYSAMYDDEGHQWLEQTTGSGQAVRTFDTLGRLHLQQRDSLNGQKITEQWDWDGNNRLRAQHDGNQGLWSTVFNGFDGPLSTTDPLKRTTWFSYIANYGLPAGSIDATGRHYCYRYDTELRPQYIYDADCPTNDRIIGAAPPLLERREYRYDLIGQIAMVATTSDASHPTRDIVSYVHDSVGRATQETVESQVTGNEDYTVQRAFTDQGRTVTTTLTGNLIGPAPPPPDPPALCCHGRSCGPCPPPPPVLTPFVATFKKQHDIADRLTSVDFNGARMASWQYGAGIGGPTSLAYGNGTTSLYGYDNRLRQKSLVVTGPATGGGLALASASAQSRASIIKGGGGGCPPGVWCPPPTDSTPQPIVSYSEAFGSDSITRMRQRQIGTGPVLTDVFQIDGNDRVTAENLQLTGITLPTGEIDDSAVAPYLSTGSRWRYFNVDPNGNWGSVAAGAAGGVSVDHTMDALGRVTAVGGSASDIDAQDNLRRVGDDSISFTFDPFWNLPLTGNNGNYSDHYTYDAVNRRAVETHTDGTRTVFLWAGDQMIAHGDPANLTIDVAGDDLDSHIATVDGAGAGTVRYYHAAPDQSILAVSDASGAVIEGYAYSAFGEVSVFDGNGNALVTSKFGNRWLYQGHLYDPLTGTYSMRARQYAPKWGRFLSPDPLGIAAAPSLYAFTGSRPLGRRDPLGTDDWDWGGQDSWLGGLLGGLIGAIIGAVEGHNSSSSNQPHYATPNNPQGTQGATPGTAGPTLVPVPTVVRPPINLVPTTVWREGSDTSPLAGQLCGPNCAYGLNGEWTWIGDKNNGTAVAPMIDPIDFMAPGGSVSTRATTVVGTKVGAAFRTVLSKIFGRSEADALNEIVLKSGIGFVDYGAKDELGRPTGVWAWLTRSMIGTGTKVSVRDIPGFVKGGYNMSRAHLLARLLGGLGSVGENLVTFALRPSNYPVMSQIEKSIAKAVTSGGQVIFHAVPVYVGDELIPREITLSITNSNGYSVVFRIVNELTK